MAFMEMKFLKPQEEVLQEINFIIDQLQTGKWDEHSEQFLLSAQGKLSTYLANLNIYLYDLNQEYTAKKLFADQQEDNAYIENRTNDESIQDSKIKARLEAQNAIQEASKLETDISYHKGILRSVETIITAIQVQLRQSNREASTKQTY